MKIKIKNIYILFLIFLHMPVIAAHQYSERYYQTKWCKAHNGIMEYRLEDKSRVDCLTKNLAVEFDFAPKWAECIGQAIYYAKKTRRTPMCVLIMENPVKDGIYLYRLRYTVYKKNRQNPKLKMKTATMTPEQVK